MHSVLDSVESLDQLQVLLVLAEDSSRGLVPSELLARTTVRKGDLEGVLAALARIGLASAEGETWRLSHDLQAVSGVTELLSQYRRDPVPLLRALTRRSVERTRAIAIQSHAHTQRLQQSLLQGRSEGTRTKILRPGSATHHTACWLVRHPQPSIPRLWLVMRLTGE